MSEDLDVKITELVKASQKKIVKKAKIVKDVDLTKMPDIKKKVYKMREDGFTTAQIASALGFEENKISLLLEERTELGTPEQILQECLKTLVDLVPLAEAEYRHDPTFHKSLALTGMIDSCKNVIAELYQLKDKEDVYRVIIQKVIQPIIRGMISDMMAEFRFLNKNLEDAPEKAHDHAQNTAINIGKKFDESYRRATELLASIIGLNQDAKARALASIALSSD